MDLTKEYFDQGLLNIMEKMVTKEDIDTLRIATKADLDARTVELKQYTQQAFEVQQLWLEERFDDLAEKNDVSKRVEKLEKDVALLKFSKNHLV